MPMIGKVDPKITKTPDEEPAANRIHHGRAPIWDSAVNFWRYGGKERITVQTGFLCKRFLERGDDPYFFAALICPNPDQWNAAFLRILMVKETFAVLGEGRLQAPSITPRGCRRDGRWWFSSCRENTCPQSRDCGRSSPGSWRTIRPGRPCPGGCPGCS